METILTIHNDYSYLLTKQEIKNFIWSKLRFRQKNYFHTRAYQNGTWDGYIDFFNKKTGKFLSGLLPEVEFTLNKLGVPYEKKDDRDILEFQYESIDENFLHQWTPPGESPKNLFDYQVDLVNQAIKYKRGIVKAPTGCHAKGQLILMYNGSLKAVEDIVENDILMGADSKPRTVMQLCRGKGLMYKITPNKGKPFIVNEDHILSLVSTTSHHNRYPSEKGGRIIDVKVKDWIKWSKWQKHIHKLFKVGIDFKDNAELSVDPYFLGLLLGDGSIKHVPGITTSDDVVVEEIKKQIDKFNLHLSIKDADRTAPIYSLSGISGKKNPISQLLRKLGLWGKTCGNKFIPEVYKTSSKSNRLKILAGLLDTDGNLNKNRSYDIISKSRILAEDIVFIARSLGFYAAINTCEKSSQNGTKGIYHRVYISGEISIIPCRIKHKIVKPYKMKYNVERTGFKIEPIGIDDFYGFSLLEDPHYLMDDFTVTHNSGKTLIFIAIMKALPPNTPTLFLVNRKTLVTQNYEEMIKWGIPNVGRFNSDYHEPNIITCANVQSLKHLEKELPKFKVLVTDEIHMLSNASGARAFRKASGASIRIAVSATPFKFGETDKVQKYTVKGHFGPTLKSQIELTTNALQERGNLSDSKCTFFPIDEPDIPYHLLIDAIEHGIAKNTHYHKIVSRLVATLKGRTLILVDRVAHGDALSNLIPNSIWVSGKDNEQTRKAVIEKLQRSKVKVTGIATRQIFDTGINFFIHNLIDCTDSKAEHLVQQIIGRGLRPCGDKEELNYYGFLLRMNPYLHDHSKDKIKILKKEGHEVIVKDSIDF